MPKNCENSQNMGQVESAIFDDAPPWDMKMILKLTDLKVKGGF